MSTDRAQEPPKLVQRALLGKARGSTLGNTTFDDLADS
jgi:hypothetical protein